MENRSQLYLLLLSVSFGLSMLILTLLGAQSFAVYTSVFAILYLLLTYGIKPRRRVKFDIVGFMVVMIFLGSVVFYALNILR